MDQFWINKVKKDGTKLEIRIRISDKKLVVDDVGVTPKGKRKMTYLGGSNLTNNYDYRKLDFKGRNKMKMDLILEVCPVEILNEALEEAWQLMKPEELH